MWFISNVIVSARVFSQRDQLSGFSTNVKAIARRNAMTNFDNAFVLGPLFLSSYFLNQFPFSHSCKWKIELMRQCVDFYLIDALWFDFQHECIQLNFWPITWLDGKNLSKKKPLMIGSKVSIMHLCFSLTSFRIVSNRYHRGKVCSMSSEVVLWNCHGKWVRRNEKNMMMFNREACIIFGAHISMLNLSLKNSIDT